MFLQAPNITNIFLQNGHVIILALGMLLIIVAGHIGTGTKRLNELGLSAREGRNPKTGEEAPIAACQQPLVGSRNYY